jgi:hypothetical protein
MCDTQCIQCDAELSEAFLFCSAKCRRESVKALLALQGLLYEPIAGGAPLQLHALVMEVRRNAGETLRTARDEARRPRRRSRRRGNRVRK